ncbi:MAG: hypothetical protein V4580_05490, partial [Bacteroidota bacterium]
MKKIQILFLFILAVFFSDAQNDVWYRYNWKEAPKFSNTIFEESQLFYETRNKGKIEVGDLLKRQAAYQTSLFYSDCSLGLYYPGFNNYETYLKQVFDKVIRDTVLSSKLRFYFSYDSDYNVDIDQLGNVKVNIGLFNYIQTEAELAAIISHAHAHFFNNEDIYIDKEKTIGQPTYLTQKWAGQLLDFYGFQKTDRLKKMESGADYLGMKFFKSSPYDLKGLSAVYKTLKRFEIKNELLYGNNRGTAKFHTDPGNRLKLANSLSSDSSNISRTRFVVDSVKFVELKKRARQESYNCMIQNHKYQEAVELSFTDYLYNPNDPENLALLIEALRRYLLLNPKSEKEQFIIENYKGKGAKKSDNYSYVYDDNTSILKYLNKGLLHLRSNDLSQLKAKDMLDTNSVRFTTNKEAFAYFVQIAKNTNCKPCLFSNVFENPKELKSDDAANLQNTVFETTSFFNDLIAKEQRSENLYILNVPIIDKLDYFAVNTTELYARFLQDYKAKFKSITGLQNVQFVSDLSYDDQHKLNSINLLSEKMEEENLYFRAIIANIESQQKMTTQGANGTMFVYNRPNTVGKTSYSHKATLNCKAISPEAVEMYSKYKVKNIYFIDFDIIVINPTNVFMHYFSGDLKTAAWKFKRIRLDGIDNVVYEQK